MVAGDVGVVDSDDTVLRFGWMVVLLMFRGVGIFFRNDMQEKCDNEKRVLRKRG